MWLISRFVSAWILSASAASSSPEFFVAVANYILMLSGNDLRKKLFVNSEFFSI